ncbi:unnamed protein product, partial [Porites evermanni]
MAITIHLEMEVSLVGPLQLFLVTLVKEILEQHNLYQENETNSEADNDDVEAEVEDNAEVEEAEVHDLDTGNRIQVDIAMQAADEQKVDEQQKTEKTSEPLQGSGASGMSALMEELKEDIQGMNAL